MRKNAKDGREEALKEQQKIEEDVVSTGTLLGGTMGGGQHVTAPSTLSLHHLLLHCCLSQPPWLQEAFHKQQNELEAKRREVRLFPAGTYEACTARQCVCCTSGNHCSHLYQMKAPMCMYVCNYVCYTCCMVFSCLF